MHQNVLITRGVGFIGSNLPDELLAHGYNVRVLDNLCPQVQRPRCGRSEYLASEMELQMGDVRDAGANRARWRVKLKTLRNGHWVNGKGPGRRAAKAL
jgi:dTDP-L-rhamnose 4-epimerase